jgi:DNA-binding CsgD family transcriptional regulator
MRDRDELFSTGEPAYAVNRDGVIRAWNSAAEREFGYRKSEALGHFCWELLAGQDLYGNQYCCSGCPLREAAFDHQSTNSNEMLLRTSSNALRRFRITRLVISCCNGADILAHLCQPLIQSPQDDGDNNSVDTSTPDDRRHALTSREREVFALLSEGLGTREMASKLCISPATVRNHIQNIFSKLKVRNRVAAINRGRKLGLI